MQKTFPGLTRITASAGLREGARIFETGIRLGSSLEEAVAIYGRDIVFNSFKAHMETALRNHIRNLLKTNRSDAEIEASLKDWTPPDNSAPDLESLVSSIDRLSTADREELLEILRL